jgi:hypothetical protein
MLRQLRFAAVPLLAGAIIALTTASVWAFSQQNLGPNGSTSGNYNFNYTDPEKSTSGDSNKKFDPNSSGFHFSIERGQVGSFGSRGFGGSNNNAPPDFYARPLGNGN